MNNQITVQLVDDHEMVRAGFRHLLEDHKHITVVVESNNGKGAVSDYAKYQPDLVLMDISMQGMSGLDATQHIIFKHPDARIIILSMQGCEAAIRSMEAGAKGFLSKAGAAGELIKAVKSVMQGHAYIDRETAQQIAMHQLNGNGHHSSLKALSVREYEIFVHLAQGTPVDQIASHCCLSPKTIRSHKSHIMQKLNLDNTIDFVRLAMKEGVIEAME